MRNVQINNILYFFIFFLFCNCKMNLQKEKKEELKFKVDTNNIDKIYEVIVLDTLKFDQYNIDFDRDGNMDKIFSNLHGIGDSLFVFKNENDIYNLSLATVNFAEDGLYQIDSITLNKEANCGLILSSHFYGHGGLERYIYYTYNDISRNWKIIKTLYISSYCDGNGWCYEKTCSALQNVILEKNTDWSKYISIDYTKDKRCKIKKFKNIE